MINVYIYCFRCKLDITNELRTTRFDTSCKNALKPLEIFGSNIIATWYVTQSSQGNPSAKLREWNITRGISTL